VHYVQYQQGRPQDFFQGVIGGGRRQWLGGTMASAEHEAITGVWGKSPQRGPGAEPLVRGPEAESIFVIGCPTEPAKLAPFQKCICISTLGATVMIWEKLCLNPGGQVTPLPLPGAPMSMSIFLFYILLIWGCVRTPPAYRRGQMRSAAGPTHCGSYSAPPDLLAAMG